MTFQTLTVSPDTDEVRVAEKFGRTHVVAPTVMVREGVLKGGYVPGDEIAYSTDGWNGRPITAPPEPGTEAYDIFPDELQDGQGGHPYDAEGNHTSANQDPYTEDMQIGTVRNVDYDESENRLVGEAWIDVERAKEVGTFATDVIAALVEGEPLDVSIGFWHDIEQTAGSYDDGSEYEYVVHNIMPDHLAMLPNESGACSWDDGCGVPRAASDFDLSSLQAIDGVSCRDAMTTASNGDDLDDDAKRTLLERFASFLGVDTARDDTTETETMTDPTDYDELAEQTGLSVDAIEALGEDDIESLRSLTESTEDDDDEAAETEVETTEPTPDDGGGDVDDLASRIDELEEKLAATQAADLDEEVDTITSATDHDEETVRSWPDDAIEAFAANVSTEETQTGGLRGVNHVAQAGAAVDPSDDDDGDDGLEKIGALRAMSNDDGGD